MVETTRITIRLPEEDIRFIDTAVDTGEFRDRTDFIRRAVRAYQRDVAPQMTKAIREKVELTAALAQAQKDLAQAESMERSAGRLAHK